MLVRMMVYTHTVLVVIEQKLLYINIFGVVEEYQLSANSLNPHCP